MATNKITLGPLPHFKDEWVAGTTYKREAIVTHHGSTYMCVTAGTQTEPSFTYNSSTGKYTVSAGWALIAVGAGAEVIEGLAQVSELKDGTLVPAMSENLESWDEDTALVATGFNLLRFATAVGTGWYILVPKLTATAASIGTAQENNGVLFTDAQGNNLRPTVRFKALADGVPTGVTDGVAATYVDADGRRHYTTSGIGYLIVSDINRATTCMHLGWSRRYDEYVAVDAAGDAGATVNLAAGINALHDFGLMLHIGALADSIERTSATQVTWYRRIDRVQPTWTNTPVEEEGVATGQYLHEALISNMRPDGAAAFMGSDQSLT